ncbi:MAG TPA: SH3 domain-containing protein, partial [Armatimonadota bacterium]|nr:SH3 domain-containing protein [Armatimonadota bacterium]
MTVYARHLLACAFVASLYAGVSGAQEDKWDNAPKIVPHTTAEMQTPAFWVNRLQNPDRVVMTPRQIEQMNARNRQLPPVIKDINGQDYSIFNVIQSKLPIGLQFNVEEPLKMRSFPGDSLRAMLQRHKDLLTRRTWYERRQMKYDQDVINALIENMNLPAVPQTVVPKYGILVQQTLNRAVPTNQAGFSNPRSWLDEFQSTSLDLGMPVAILQPSKDGKWLYVRSEIAFGWVPAENVAVGSAAELSAYDSAKDILVALDYNVPVYGDPGFERYMVDLFLGSHVKLV